jgi:hypothetical protein
LLNNPGKDAPNIATEPPIDGSFRPAGRGQYATRWRSSTSPDSARPVKNSRSN